LEQGKSAVLDEWTIIKQVKANNSNNFESLFVKYIPIVRKMWRDYTIRDFDWDDWVQEGRIVFFNSVINYDSDLDITLGAFFRTNFKNRIFSILRFEMAYKRRAGYTAQTLDDPAVDLESFDSQISKITPQNALMIKENYAEYETLLSKFEREVSILLFQGHTPHEIAAEMGHDVVKIQNALVRCKQKLSQQLYGRY
jgi:RNA polymerase sporulation-specific sigma factor